MGKRANGEGSIYYDSERKRWLAAVVIGRDPATGKQVRRKVSGKTKAEAAAAKEKLLAKYKDAYYIDADKITVGEWIDKYLTTYKKGTVRQNTYESYTYIAKTYVMPYIGSIVLDKLLPVQIQQLISKLAADKSPRTAEYALTVIKMAARRAADEGIIGRDPARGIKRPHPDRREIQTITPDEAKRLVDAAYSPKARVAVQILCATGMRTEELLGLTWPKIDLTGRRITIDQVVITTRGGPKIERPKTKSSLRVISIPPGLVSDLKAYRKAQAAHILKTKDYQDSGYVLCRDCGLPILPRDYSRMFARVAKRAAVTITAHGLRHTHATQLFAAGWNAKDVQTRLGHASVTLTLDTYTHYIPSRDQDIADYLEQIYPK